MKPNRVHVAISGIAGSGKTTLARLIERALLGIGVEVEVKDDDQESEVHKLALQAARELGLKKDCHVFIEVVHAKGQS